MYCIRTLVAALLAISASAALADAPPPPQSQTQPPPQDFLAMKQAAMQRLTSEMRCLQAAQNPQALQQCRPRPPAGGPEGRPQGGPDAW